MRSLLVNLQYFMMKLWETLLEVIDILGLPIGPICKAQVVHCLTLETKRL
jgi:hypothetical protein